MAAWEAPPYPIRAAGVAVPAFVGRTAETSAAQEAWAAVLAGGRQVMFIGGEPGAGKSRLAAEIATAVYRQGAVVLLGRCAPEPGGPYQPFTECLEHLLGATQPGALADCRPDAAAELLRLTPLAWRHWPELTAPSGAGGDYRRELFDAVAGLLHAVGSQRPVLCVLEDLHWAGQPTLQLLDHIAQRSASSRLLLLCTHRTTAPDRTDDLTYAIADMYRLDGVRRLDLAGLSAEEVAQYLQTEGGLSARRAREYATVLRDQTGGNPFFLREAWREITVSGLPGRGLPPSRTLGAHAPASVRDTLQRRLARLTPTERAAVETAAVLGDGGDVRVVVRACSAGARETGAGAQGASGAADVTGPDAASVLAALDAAVKFGLLDGAELSSGKIAFPHSLTRQAVLDLTGPSRQAALHAQVGEVLQAAGGSSPRVVRQLAYHFARAAVLGYGDKAAAYLEQAARDAERGLAFEDAAAWYSQAADLLEGSDTEREELWFAAAACHVRAGDFASARARYLRLFDSAEPQVRLRAAIGYEDAAWRPGLPGSDACTMLIRALDDVPADPDDPRYVRALASLGRAAAFTGDAARAKSLAEQALAYARRLGDGQLLRYALHTMMWQPTEPASIGRHRELAHEVGALGTAARDWEMIATSAVFLAAIAYVQADQRAWADAAAELDQAVRGSGQLFLAFFRRCSDFARAFLNGDWAAATLVAEDLLEIGRSFGPDDTEGQYGLQMYMIQRETGALEPVRPLLDGISQSGGTWEPGLLALYTELGMTGPAHDLLWQLLEPIDAEAARQPPWTQWTAVLVFLVEAALALGDTDAARRLRPLLAPYTGQQLIAGQFVAVFGPADTYLAALDALLGHTSSAQRLFTAALAQATSFGAVIHRASTLTAWAIATGDADKRDAARRLATSTGQARLIRLLDSSALAAKEAPVSPDGPDTAGLTPREIAVLQLLADGSSNREIANRLKITENTAANHVRSILLKTGAANRTQVAMLAVAKGWVLGGRDLVGDRDRA
jgi:DNA-binding CsgD family transcriptional regulator